MQRFRYTALNLDGKKIKGIICADDNDSLISNLRADNLFLVKSKCLYEKESKSKRLKDMEVSAFSKEIASMTGAGISINKAMQVLIKGNQHPKQKGLYIEIYKCLSKGMTLSEALEMQGNAFPSLFINMYRTGEESGNIAGVAQKMAKLYENQHMVSSKVKSAMLYPKILCCLMVLVVIVIFTIVMPKLFNLFEGMELPLPTRIMIFLSNGIINHWLTIIIVILIAVIAVKLILSVNKVRFAVDRLKLKLPVIGKLNCTIYTARFARTLSSLYSSGLAIDRAMKICGGAIGNRYLEPQFSHAISMLRTGSSISSSIESIDGFDSKLVMTVFVGQESGQLDEMLDSISDSFDNDAQISSQKLVALLEPVMIVFLAVMVAFIALSIMLPLMNIYNTIG